MGKMPGICVFNNEKLLYLYNSAACKREKDVVSYRHKEELKKTDLPTSKIPEK